MKALRIGMLMALPVIALAGFAIVSSNGGPGRDHGMGAQADGVIRVVINADIRGTNPGVTRDGNTDMVMNHIVESLVAYRADLTVAPLVAQNYTVSDDFRTFRFVIRDGLLFHNGAPVTSAEVKWSWTRMLDPKVGFRCRSWYDGSDPEGIGAKIVSIDTPDARTVVFHLDRPNTLFLDQMASLQCITAILHPDSVDAEGKWIGPISTGPYRLRNWKHGDYVEIEKFPGYHPRNEPEDGYAGGRIAKTPVVRFMIIPEPSVAESAIKAGDVDLFPRVPGYLLTDANNLSGLRAQSHDQLSWNMLIMQTRDPLLSDIRVRRAIAHAVNVDQVAAITTYGKARANPSAVAQFSPYHSAAHDRWIRYDPAEARRLLAEAGYDGRPIYIQTNRKSATMFDNAVAIQAMLVAAGVNARLEVLDWATHLSNNAEGKFQLSLATMSARAHPALMYAAFLGSKDKNPAVVWDSRDARRLLRDSSLAQTPAEQREIYDRLHLLMRNDVPLIGLYNETITDLVRDDVHGYHAWAIGNPRLWGVTRGGR